ncbi:hypothetical protein [Microbacterium sp. A1-JK]|uniref:hypothetical protein n=1 Tax=Microbacterium sp. A1-JK TaxID=3177516 RepID=UPI0038897398
MNIVALVSRELDRLGVAEGDLRRVAVSLAQLCVAPDMPVHLVPATAALEALMNHTREVYAESTPLQDEINYLRAARIARNEGVELPPYDPRFNPDKKEDDNACTFR